MFSNIYFGWWTVLTGVWFNLWATGFTAYGFSAMLKPIALDLGVSRAAVSAASGIARLEGGLAIVVGWVVDRAGPRWPALVGTLLLGLGLVLMYFVNSLWSFYLVWGALTGFAQMIGAGIAIEKAITNWFVKKRGLALGIRMMVPGAAILPLISWLIINRGWRLTSVVGGVVLWLVGLPLVWFFIKSRRPEYYGLLPDGARVKEETADPSQMLEKGVKYAAEAEEIEFTLRQIIRTPVFWMLSLAQAVNMAGFSSLHMHAIPFLTDIGISPTKAAAMVTVAGLVSGAARFIAGYLGDRLRKGQMRFLFASAIFLLASGPALVAIKPSGAIPMIYLLLIFLGFGINLVLLPLLGSRYFGRKAFSSFRGVSGTVALPFGILGPIYVGWTYDIAGSYQIAFITIAAACAVGGILALLLQPPKPPDKIASVEQII